MERNNTQAIGAFDPVAVLPASASRQETTASKRSGGFVPLLPHEHGAYGQLGFPLLTAWLIGQANWPAAAATLACVTGFWLHEPALILFGRRGVRAANELRHSAWRALAVLVPLALAGAAAAWLNGGWSLRFSFLLLLLWAVLVAAAARRGVDRRIGFELFSCLGLAVCALPVGLAAAVPLKTMLGVVAIWGIVQCGSVLAIHGVIARAKRRPRPAAGYGLAIIAVPALAAAAAGLVNRAWLAQALPLLPALTIVALLEWRAPSARHLRRLGWLLIGANAITLLLMPGVWH